MRVAHESVSVSGLIFAALGGALLISACAKVFERDQLEIFLAALGFSSVARRLTITGGSAGELAIACALIGHVAPVESAIAALMMTTSFVLIHLVARTRRIDMRCGCFGLLEVEMAAPHDLLRAVVFMVCTIALVTAVSLGTMPSGGALTSILGAFVGIGVVLGLTNLLHARHTLEQANLKVSEVSS